MVDLIRQRVRLIKLCCSAGVFAAVAVVGCLAVLPMVKSGRASIQSANKLTLSVKMDERVSATIGFGFMATSTAVNNAFPGRKVMLSVIDSIHWIVVAALEGAIIGALT